MQPAFIGANGVRFAYREQGAGPLVLLAHGFPSETAQVKEALAYEGFLEAACAYYAALDPRRLPAGHKPNIKVPSAARARRCFDGAYEVLCVPGGHFMHREHPREFIAALTGVLRRLKSV